MRHHSRRLRLSALMLGVAIIAAGCGGDDDEEGTDEGTSETTAGEESAVAAPEIGDAAPECTGEADGVLRIGALLPETGDLSFLGPPAIAAAGLAVADINEAGGVLGAPVEYLRGDSGDADPDIANPTVDSHLSAGADVILGAESSGVSLNVLDKIVGACKIMFSPANTSPQFTDYDDDDLYFRTAPSDILQGQVLSELMLEDGVATAALLARQDAYGEGLLEFTQAPFEEGGGEVVVDRTYDPEAQTFEAEVDEVISEDPDALVMIGFDESSRILSSLFEQGFTPDEKKIYLVDGNIGNATGEDFTEPGTLVGVRGTLPSAEVTEDFRARLLEQDPALTDLSYGPETYDAVTITALATVAADTDDPAAVAAQINGVTRDGEACETFADCLAMLEAGDDIDYNGPSGPQDFSQPGEPTEASFAVQSYGEDNRIDEAAVEYRTASLG
jgi:ABC-type branched-subunit amino acid transport system substrate-binding protein